HAAVRAAHLRLLQYLSNAVRDRIANAGKATSGTADGEEKSRARRPMRSPALWHINDVAGQCLLPRWLNGGAILRRRFDRASNGLWIPDRGAKLVWAGNRSRQLQY